MFNKLKTVKKNIVRYLLQLYADYLYDRMKKELSSKDNTQFYLLFEQAAQLNAYCIVFHDIYLD